jgi:glutathione S-transferase
MKLYYSPGACSLSPHIVLEEAGIAYEPVLASTKTHKLQDGTDYYTINPKGYVPLLELDNGERLSEGPAIVQYIADQVPAKKLAPANGTMARYRLQEWLNFTTSEIHKTYSPMFNPATPEEYKTIARAKLQDRYRYIDSQLEGKSYLMGSDFSVADAYLFTVTNWAKNVGVDLAALKNVAAFMTRMAARPAVQQAMKAEGLIK